MVFIISTLERQKVITGYVAESSNHDTNTWYGISSVLLYSYLYSLWLAILAEYISYRITSSKKINCVFNTRNIGTGRYITWLFYYFSMYRWIWQIYLLNMLKIKEKKNSNYRTDSKRILEWNNTCTYKTSREKKNM